MKTLQILLLFGIIFTVFATGSTYETVNASKAYGWSPDAKVPGYLDDTFTPFLLADRNRTVHAFASQWVNNSGQRLAITYRQWSFMGGWTRPIDIILAPTSGDANFMWAYLDSSDVIHVIFMATENQKSSVYYSSAPAALADWATAWSVPMLVGDGASELHSGAITGDEQGDLIIVYSGTRDGNGVYYTRSTDSGRTWSAPLFVFLTYDSNLSVFSLRLAIGPEQKARAVWNVVTNVGVDNLLYFSTFDFQSAKWDVPIQLDKRIEIPDYFGPSFPSIVDNGREIVVVYNSGNPFDGRPVNAGRPVQRVSMSIDGGLTWNEPLSPFPFHLGRSGEHTVVLDGNGTPHTLFVQRIESLDDGGKQIVVSGIWHSEFINGGWTNPDRLVTQLVPHDVRATVVQGNVILTVWREDPGAGVGGIWYSYSVLDIPELPAVPLVTPPVDYSIQEVPTVALVFEQSTPEVVPSSDVFSAPPPSTMQDNPALPIIISTILVLLLLIGIVLGYRYFLQRRE